MAVRTISLRGSLMSQICGGRTTGCGNLTFSVLIALNTKRTSSITVIDMRCVCCIAERIFRVDLRLVHVEDRRPIVSVSLVLLSSKSLLPVFLMATCNTKFDLFCEVLSNAEVPDHVRFIISSGFPNLDEINTLHATRTLTCDPSHIRFKSGPHVHLRHTRRVRTHPDVFKHVLRYQP